MRVIGIASDANSFFWALLEGKFSNPQLLAVSTAKIKYPTPGDEPDRLFELKRTVSGLLVDHKAERVAILQAVGSQYGGPSLDRVKAECVFQLAAREHEIQAIAISPKTVTAQEGKFLVTVGAAPEEHLNNGKQISPKLLRKAVLTGWVGLR
jgi:hypothetical protein